MDQFDEVVLWCCLLFEVSPSMCLLPGYMVLHIIS